MTDHDEQMNSVIRLLTGREVELEDEQGEDRQQYEFAPDLKSDADVNAWIRRQAGRA
jgi:hypothetical protein